MYLKVLTRWISIKLDFDLNLALFCSTLPVALLVVDLPPSHSLSLWFAWDLESLYSLLTCLCVDLCFFGLVCLGPRVALLVVVLSPSIFHVLCCSTPRVTLLILDLSPSQSLPLWFARHLQLICSLLTCLDSLHVSTFRAFCWNLDSLCLLFSCLWRLSKYSYFRQTGSCKLMFHSPKLLSIRPFSHRFEFGLSSCFLFFCYIAFLKRLPST